MPHPMNLARAYGRGWWGKRLNRGYFLRSIANLSGNMNPSTLVSVDSCLFVVI